MRKFLSNYWPFIVVLICFILTAFHADKYTKLYFKLRADIPAIKDSVRQENFTKAWELGYRMGYHANSITNKVQLKKQHYKDSVAFTKLLK